ncbi:MAG: methionyl-tRNA formyltransferase [Bacteroidales bacterium]|nr:methionyl-tRNA formyltransferase [Bacteroidales bacterium]
MEKKDFRIIFMGTPGFAVSALEALVNDGQNIVAVITAPDKPAGRGLNLKESEVKQYALTQNLPILQPDKLKDPLFVEKLQKLQPDLAVVVAFRMLPEVIWAMPRLGTINLHASLLPQYRGAAPINWAIMNGEQVTGITTFFIEKEIDTGKVIGKAEIEITNEDTAGTLHDKLAQAGAGLLTETVNSIRLGNYSPISQDQLKSDVLLKPAPKIFRENCKINWNQPVKEIYNFIRGLSPYPGAWTMISTTEGAKTFKILSCEMVHTKLQQAGMIYLDKNSFRISGIDGFIIIHQLQPEGKRVMKIDEFLHGNREASLTIIRY